MAQAGDLPSSPPVPRRHHGRSAQRSATGTFTKGRSLRKKLRQVRHDGATSGSVSTLDSISEDEESINDEGDFDKDMAYAVQIDPDARLGDEAAVAALFAEDTDEPGILEPDAGKEHLSRKHPTIAPPSKGTKASEKGSPTTEKQARLTKADGADTGDSEFH